VSVATVATQWERGKIIRRALARRTDTNDNFTDDNFFTAARVPSVQLHYTEMVTVGEETSATSKNAVPAVRIVSYDATANLEMQAERVAQDVLNALTEPLNEREAFAGMWEFDDEPRYLTEGDYEQVRWAMEGNLIRCATTISSAQFTDGSPVALPTDRALQAMLAATSQHPDKVIGPIQVSGTPATVKDVAIQGIMAGMKPETMPILLALTECMVYTHDFGEQLNGADGWFVYATVISGPIASDRTIRFNTGGPGSAGPAPLTPGVPTNTGLGRFLRLMMVNIGGNQPGVMEAKGIGHPAKTSLVVAEAHAETGWPGFASIIGRDPVGYKTGVVNNARFRADENTVSLFVLWGNMTYSLSSYSSFTSPDISPGGVVPAARPEWVDWLTDRQYTVCRTELQSAIAAGRLLIHQQGLTAFTRVATARSLHNAGVTREMAARFVSEFCADTNSFAQRQFALGSTVQGATFTVQGENMHEEWNSGWWMPSLADDPKARVRYFPNPKLINFVIGPSLTWSPMIMAGLPRWTASIEEWK